MELVYLGAAHCAQDDLNEGDGPLDDDAWCSACALVIEANPESFLAWYRQAGR